MVGRFRRRPAVIEAIRWTGKNWIDVFEFAQRRFENQPDGTDEWNCHLYVVETSEWCRVEVGDWVVRDGKRLGVMSPGEFHAAYEELGMTS